MAFPTGSLLIPNSNLDLALGTGVVLSQVDGSVLGTVAVGFISCEFAVALPDGTFIASEQNGAGDVIGYRIYDAAMTELANLTYASLGGGAPALNLIPLTSDGTRFYVAVYTGVTMTIRAIAADGTVDATVWTIAGGEAANMSMMAVNTAGVLYWAQAYSNNKAIHRFDLIGNVPLTNFVAADPTVSWNADAVVLASQDVLVVAATAGGNFEVRRYNPAAALQETYALGVVNDVDVPRVALAPDPDQFWVRSNSVDDLTSLFQRLAVTGGAVLTSFTVTNLDGGGDVPSSCPTLPLLGEDVVDFTLTSVSAMACERPTTQRLTLTGTGFEDGLSVAGTDPLGEALVISVDAVTDTSISISFTSPEYGQFCFTVSQGEVVSSEVCMTSTSCTEPVTMRRLRRATHISNENQWTFYKSFTLDYEAGVGLTSGQGSDPEILLRWSDDGGHVFTQWHALKIGKLGEYKHRAIWRRLGRSRKRTFEVVCSDPIKLVLLEAFIELEEGTS